MSYILKYKTALVGSTYYTVEDALATAGTTAISFAGDSTNETSYVYTSFTKKEYLTVCKDIVGKRDTIECIGMDILHSHEDKYLLGNKIIELIEEMK